jgi:hypothetical protein
MHFAITARNGLALEAGDFRYHTHMEKQTWTCEAHGYFQGIGGFAPPRETVQGVLEQAAARDACRNAKRDATQQAPPGTYARHLKCRCQNDGPKWN